MRSGSTLLSEVLTRLPQSYIFQEPHIGKNDFQLTPSDVEIWAERGLDLERLLRRHRVLAFLQRRLRWAGLRQDYMAVVLKHLVRPRLASGRFQLGVKEVRNRGWRNYRRQFPSMKVIVTARDPRDIYLSTMYRWRKGLLPRRKLVTPELIARELNREFKLQMAIQDAQDSFLVRYEDMCQQPTILGKIMAFIESPLSQSGSVGGFTSRHPDRVHEAHLHGNAVTDKRVARWRREKDSQLRREAEETLALMPAYARFWGYRG